MPIQAISWSPSGAVRIIDQRALPEAEIARDLESAESVADAIRQLQVRGAPLIGIAAAMGLVAGMREQRTAARAEFLPRLQNLAVRFWRNAVVPSFMSWVAASRPKWFASSRRPSSSVISRP